MRSLRPMREDDLDAIMAIERRAYPFPWTRGIFRDCLARRLSGLGAAATRPAHRLCA